MKRDNRYYSVAAWCLVVICANTTIALASSHYTFEGEAAVIERSQIPDPNHYVRNVTDPNRDAYERVLRIEKITMRQGHGVTLNEGSILFVQTTNDPNKMAVGYYPIVLTGGEKTLKSLEQGHRYSFLYTGSDSVRPTPGPIGSATFTILQFANTEAAKVADLLLKLSVDMRPVPNVTQDDKTVNLSYNTRTFMVYSTDKVGRHSEQAHEVIGPKYDGLITQVTVEDGRYIGAAEIPQDIRQPYWTAFVNAYPIAKGKQHLHVNISYGARTDRENITKVKKLLESMIDDDPKLKEKIQE